MAVISAVLAAMMPSLPLALSRPISAIALRLLLGLTVFLLAATGAAGVAAYWQHYPHGLGRFLG